MKVILSVGQGEDGDWRDLELSANLPLAELMPSLLAALGEGREEGWELWAAPPERPVALDQTLAAAGVWDGSWLLLRPA